MGSTRVAVGIACVAALALGIAVAALGADTGGGPLVVRSAGSTTDPVAVIEPLPDLVSNGTAYHLDGSSSYDLADDLVTVTSTIVNHTWEVTFEDETSYVYGPEAQYTFSETGLYEIKLTVTDSWGNTGVDFTAVMSVDDVDCDGMPDWWELHFLGSIDADPAADPDSDGYTNIEEWFVGTSPDVADPAPETGFLEENWVYLITICAGAVAVVLVLYPGIERKRKAREAKRLEIALELEKSIEEE